jgi:hypothetical protein
MELVPAQSVRVREAAPVLEPVRAQVRLLAPLRVPAQPLLLALVPKLPTRAAGPEQRERQPEAAAVAEGQAEAGRLLAQAECQPPVNASAMLPLWLCGRALPMAPRT